jgi:dimethylhistidine N-methyltransferase
MSTALAREDRLHVVEADSGLHADFAADVARGLAAPKKHIPCRWLYDDAGSALFEQICALPEYYLTRAELAILRAHADEIAALAPADAELVELGSGSSSKTRVLIHALLDRQLHLHYLPIDISRSMLVDSARALLAEHHALSITAVAAEYRAGLAFLARHRGPPRLISWLGSNVGNYDRREAATFLRRVRAMMTPRDRFLVGIDLRKSAATLEAAYADSAGVTAAFNLNLLTRINRELGGDLDPTRFAHRALWRPRAGRVEMHLVSDSAHEVHLSNLGQTLAFTAGETIHTESSYKYDAAEIETLAHIADMTLAARWLDDDGRFSLNLLAPVD